MLFRSLGGVVVLYCLVRGPLEWKLFLIFCGLVFAASLWNPMVSMTTPQWQVLKASPGIRYWFFPMLGFAWALIWCALEGRSAAARVLSAAGLVAMCVGVIRDWEYPAYTDEHFSAAAARFEAAPPGVLVVMPIYPDGWTIRLSKRPPGCAHTPLGTVDDPGHGARVSGMRAVSGWAAGPDAIQQVKVYVDRAAPAVTVPNSRRPDVDAFYPQWPSKNKGWRTVVDFTHAEPGAHEIEARAVAAGGCEIDIDVVPVEVTRAGVP